MFQLTRLPFELLQSVCLYLSRDDHHSLLSLKNRSFAFLYNVYYLSKYYEFQDLRISLVRSFPLNNENNAKLVKLLLIKLFEKEPFSICNIRLSDRNAALVAEGFYMSDDQQISQYVSNVDRFSGFYALLWFCVRKNYLSVISYFLELLHEKDDMKLASEWLLLLALYWFNIDLILCFKDLEGFRLKFPRISTCRYTYSNAFGIFPDFLSYYESEILNSLYCIKRADLFMDRVLLLCSHKKIDGLKLDFSAGIIPVLFFACLKKLPERYLLIIIDYLKHLRFRIDINVVLQLTRDNNDNKLFEYLYKFGSITAGSVSYISYVQACIIIVSQFRGKSVLLKYLHDKFGFDQVSIVAENICAISDNKHMFQVLCDIAVEKTKTSYSPMYSIPINDVDFLMLEVMKHQNCREQFEILFRSLQKTAYKFNYVFLINNWLRWINDNDLATSTVTNVLNCLYELDKWNFDDFYDFLKIKIADLPMDGPSYTAINEVLDIFYAKRKDGNVRI